MNMILRQAVIAAWVTTALAAGVRAGIILDQQPWPGGGPASDTEFVSASSGLPTWQLIADNFLLSEAAVVRRVVFWGFYGGNFDLFPEPAPLSETMRIRFYGARFADGLPDDENILFQESFLNPSRIATGRTIAVGPLPPEYRYEVDFSLPLDLDANTLYWLEIVQLGDIDSLFRWEFGFGTLDGHTFLNANVSDWREAPGSFAFQLSSVPEPGTLGPLLCIVPFLFRHSGGKRRRHLAQQRAS